MRWTNALIPTLKEDPQDAEVISHKLMVRGGFIRKLFSGAYSYLPLGLRVLHKIQAIIREEMNAAGAQEVLLPAIHPPDLWKQTGRYDVLGDVLIKFKDRHGRELVLGPTHEEIITDLVANNVKSYKNLPLTLYQIQTKFRDEPRPRFGVMRTSEFIMKDAYSFDCDADGLEKSYEKMYKAYCRIFSRCALPYIPVMADPGMMGGNVSHEFMVPSEAGEDLIVTCEKCGYAASTQIAKCVEGPGSRVSRPSDIEGRDRQGPEEKLPIKEVNTPNTTTIEKVAELLKIPQTKLIKTLIYKADGAPVALLIRGDHEANDVKLKNYLKAGVLELADEDTIKQVTGAPVGFSGPVGLKGLKIIADNSVQGITNAATGANKKDMHFVNVNMPRDFQIPEFGDFRVITKDDKCPSCGVAIQIKRSIEVGHTFKLGMKYSESLNARFLDKDGKEKVAIMGCYGIGVNRIASTLIETSNDQNGIIWPLSIAPYEVVIIGLNMDDAKVKELSEGAYKALTDSGFDVLFDDRAESAGIKFKDVDLVGIPIKVVVGAKNAKNDIVEVKLRKDGKVELVKIGELASYLTKLKASLK
jgi:prolyl-tRNA synthetase